MADILLFGATGYTGRLTALALARRSAYFVIAGRNRAKLESLAAETGGPEIRTASADDVDGLTHALEGIKVIITCVGPFVRLGQTAVEAALRARCHYIDSTGEGVFIRRLIEEYDGAARAAEIAMAPALGFDEVPADVAATLAVEGFEKADLVVTYALPTTPSSGTAKSVLGIVTEPGRWIVDGEPVDVRTGARERWAPMPPPLGPRFSVSYPNAEGYLAPLHLDLESLRIFGTSGRAQALALKALPVLSPVLNQPSVRSRLEGLIDRLVKEPEGTQRNAPWTILAEATSGSRRRNVALAGRDVYGLTAETLSAGALRMTESDFSAAGVIAPVQAVGIDRLQKELIDQGVSIDIYES